VFGDRAHPVDINGDVGEGVGQDPELIPVLTSVNIACGGHAGNLDTMQATVRLAARHGVAVGAHPSYPDREHFGRRFMPMSDSDVEQCVAEQVRALAEVAALERVPIRHVKPHGALYNVAARDPLVAQAIARAVASIDRRLVLVGLARSELIAAGARAGLATASEVFADRAYHADGTLVARDTPGAVLHDPAVIVPRAVRMVRDCRVTAVDGHDVALRPDTICVHGDAPGAVAIAVALRNGLEDAGIWVAPLGGAT
jgi:UPF0271 protein